MKKTFNIFVLMFSIILLTLCIKITSYREVDRVMNAPFTHSIHLRQNKGSEKVLDGIIKMCKNYKLTVIRPINNYRDSDYYIFSPNEEFQNDILKISGNEHFQNITNKPTTPEDKMFSMFYNNKINFKPIENLKGMSLEGNFNIYARDLNNFLKNVDKINNDYADLFSISVENSFLYLGQGSLANYEISIYSEISLAMFIVSCILSIYIINSQKRDFAIRKLNGYSDNRIFKNAFIRCFAFPIIIIVIISLAGTIIYLLLNKFLSNIGSLWIFVKNLKYYFLLLCILAMFIAVYLKIIISRLKAWQIPLIIKSGDKNGNFLNQAIVFASMFIVLLSLTNTYPSLVDTLDKRAHVNTYKQYMDYAKIGIWHSKDTKDSEIIEVKELWKILNDNGAILFSKIGEIESPVSIDFIYINKNYIDISEFKSQENLSDNLSEDENTMDVIIPKSLEKYENEILYQSHLYHIRDKFLYEDILNNTDRYNENINNSKIRENIHYVDDNLNLFSFSVVAKLKNNNVFLVINDKNSGGNAYVPTLSSLNIPSTPKIKDKIDKFFERSNMENMEYTLTPLKVEMGDGIEFYELNLKLSISIFIISFIFLIMSMYAYVSIYFKNNRNKIAIKKFLGFSFFNSHKKIIINIIIIELTVFALSAVVNKYIENQIKYLYVLNTGLFISGVVLIFNFIVFTMFLKRNEKYKIVEALKGE